MVSMMSGVLVSVYLSVCPVFILILVHLQWQQYWAYCYCYCSSIIGVLFLQHGIGALY